MLKSLLAFLCLCLSSISFASGKLTFKPSYDRDNKETKYCLGLAIYERPLKFVGLNAWLGGGSDADGSDAWAKADVSAESYIKALTFGLGFSSEYDYGSKDHVKEYYAKFSYKIW